MTFKVGDWVRYIYDGDVGQITRITEEWIHVDFRTDGLNTVIAEEIELELDGEKMYGNGVKTLEYPPAPLGKSDTTAVNPNHYVFPGGVEVRQISAHLTSFGGQAVQYVARATRLDGQNKGEAVEDLKKAIKFLTWEIERIEESK